MGRSFEDRWNRGVIIFMVAVVAPLVIAVYSTGSLEMTLSALAAIVPLGSVFVIGTVCEIIERAKNKGP